MAHVSKFTASDTKKLFQESERDYQGQRWYKNEVDVSRSHLNYELTTHGNKPQKQLEQRLSEVDQKRRSKDTNIMCSWIVTLPQGLDFSEDEERLFFDETHKFLEARYGSENTVASTVHKDETQPHLHFRFVPVMDYVEKKTGEERQKLCAKDVVNRKDLQTFHGDLSEHLEAVYGYDVGILNEATKDGNESIERLRQKSAKKQQEELDKKKIHVAVAEKDLNLERKDFEEEKTLFKQDRENFDNYKKNYKKREQQEIQKALQQEVVTFKGINAEMLTLLGEIKTTHIEHMAIKKRVNDERKAFNAQFRESIIASNKKRQGVREPVSVSISEDRQAEFG